MADYRPSATPTPVLTLRVAPRRYEVAQEFDFVDRQRFVIFRPVT